MKKNPMIRITKTQFALACLVTGALGCGVAGEIESNRDGALPSATGSELASSDAEARRPFPIALQTYCSKIDSRTTDNFVFKTQGQAWAALNGGACSARYDQWAADMLAELRLDSGRATPPGMLLQDEKPDNLREAMAARIEQARDDLIKANCAVQRVAEARTWVIAKKAEGDFQQLRSCYLVPSELPKKLGKSCSSKGTTLRRLFQLPLGDLTNDHQFDSSDLVAMFQAGKYEDQLEGNSSYSDGDFNCDGDTTSADLVAAYGAPQIDPIGPGPR